SQLPKECPPKPSRPPALKILATSQRWKRRDKHRGAHTKAISTISLMMCGDG
ncbi:hypothetical protein AALO_G00208320, partial [Alosa alosa]